MNDGSQPLDPKREKFIKFLLLGDSAAKAYKKVYPKAAQRTAEVEGSIWRNQPEVRLRFAWFQKGVEKKTFLTLEEKRDFLALSVRTPIGEIDENHVLCQSMKRRRLVKPGVKTRDDDDDAGIENSFEEWEIEEIKVVDKLKSIELDNVMAGHNKPTEIAVSGEITVTARLAELRSRKYVKK